MKKLAIFDLDGTLFNTNEVNYFAYKEALEEYNYELDYNYYCDFCNGRHYKVFLPEIVGDKDEIIENIHNKKKELYLKYLDKAKVNIHLFEFISCIKEIYNIALVTTASKKNTLEILNYYNKLSLFDLILTHNDVKKVKPDPEGFLKAIDHFKVKKEDCVIFEDSLVGIQAALKAGTTVFKVEKF